MHRREQAWVRVLRALGDPTRYRMVAELAKAGELCCGAMGERFPLAQPTISHHLKVLTEAGLVTVRRRGQHSLLSLDRAALRAALEAVGRQLSPAVTGAGHGAAAPRPRGPSGQSRQVRNGKEE